MATTITRTLKSSGGDYSSRSAFEAAVPANIVTTDELWDGEIYAFEDTTGVTVAGITTDATRYVQFRVAAGEGHAGVWDNAKARLTGTGYYEVQTQYTRITGDQASTSYDYFYTVRLNADNCRADKMILKTTGAGSYACVLNGNNTLLRNSVVFDSPNGVYANLGANHYCYNVTVQNCTIGVDIDEAGKTLYCKNVLVKGGTTCFRQTAGTMDVNYCASSDATADDWGGTGNRVSQTFTFVNEAGDDFHLASSDAGALDYGTDLSGDANFPFSDDIDGETRSGSWDIGADEYIAAGGGVVGQILKGKTMESLTLGRLIG